MNVQQYIASGILEQYALGLLNPTEAQEVETNAAQYPEIREELDAIRGALTAYAAQHTATPPPDLRQRVLDAAAGKPVLPREVKPTATERPAPVRRAEPSRSRAANAATKSTSGGTSGIAWGLAGLLAVGLAVLGYLWVTASGERDRLNQQLDAQRTELATTQSSCAEVEEQLNAAQTELAFWKNARAVPLTYRRGRDKSPLAIVYWNDQTQSAQLRATENLQAPPAGRVYQLWAAVGSDLISLGTFTDNVSATQNLTHVANVDAFNVTVEPTGGSETPTLRTLFANAEVG